MSRLRLLLAWLVMAAIPLQGLAAASMLFCGMGGHHGPAQIAEAPAHDHSKHSHAAEVQDQKTPDNSSGGQKLPDGAHKCGICAACCHSVAINEVLQLAVFGPVPQAECAEPFVLVHARPSPVPDKPPRA